MVLNLQCTLITTLISGLGLIQEILKSLIYYFSLVFVDICLSLQCSYVSLFRLLQCPSPSQQTLIVRPASQVNQPPKTKEPPRYEDAIKQSRNQHLNHLSQVR